MNIQFNFQQIQYEGIQKSTNEIQILQCAQKIIINDISNVNITLADGKKLIIYEEPYFIGKCVKIYSNTSYILLKKIGSIKILQKDANEQVVVKFQLQIETENIDKNKLIEQHYVEFPEGIFQNTQKYNLPTGLQKLQIVNIDPNFFVEPFFDGIQVIKKNRKQLLSIKLHQQQGISYKDCVVYTMYEIQKFQKKYKYFQFLQPSDIQFFDKRYKLLLIKDKNKLQILDDVNNFQQMSQQVNIQIKLKTFADSAIEMFGLTIIKDYEIIYLFLLFAIIIFIVGFKIFSLSKRENKEQLQTPIV